MTAKIISFPAAKTQAQTPVQLSNVLVEPASDQPRRKTETAVITTFDQTTAKDVRTKVRAVLEQFANEIGVGIKLDRGSLSFSGAQFTVPITFVIKGENGVLETEEREAYKTEYKNYGLQLEWLGKTFVYKGDTFTITGLKDRSAKFPVQAINASGATFGFSATDIVGYMTGDLHGAYDEKYRKAYLESFHALTVKGWKEWLNKPFQYEGLEVKAIGLMQRTRKPDVVIMECVSGDHAGEKDTFSIEVFTGAITGKLDEALKQQTKERVLGFKNNWYKREKFDIPNNWLGVRISLGTNGDDVHTIVGLDTKRKRYPIVLQNAKGKLSGNTVASIKALMMTQHPELSQMEEEKFVE